MKQGEEEIEFIERHFGYRFKVLEALRGALTHRSFVDKQSQDDYERLEFLGDAVLGLAVGHLLLDLHPQAPEGKLSKMRAALVNTLSLAAIARHIGLGKFIRLSNAEMTSGGADKPSILADVMEAILGALYREAGFEAARNAVNTVYGDRLREVRVSDPKTELQELLHALEKGTPEYLLEKVEGPDHAPLFVSSVHIGGELFGRGSGTTKKVSQQEAAREALEALRKVGATV